MCENHSKNIITLGRERIVKVNHERHTKFYLSSQVCNISQKSNRYVEPAYNIVIFFFSSNCAITIQLLFFFLSLALTAFCYYYVLNFFSSLRIFFCCVVGKLADCWVSNNFLDATDAIVCV